MRALLLATFFASLPAQPSRAAAQPAARLQLELEWRAPPGCPSEAFVRERVRALLGAKAEQRQQFEVHAVVSALRTGFLLKLSIRSRELSGERSIQAETCRDLAAAAAVAIALFAESEELPNPDQTALGPDRPSSSAAAGGSTTGNGASAPTTNSKPAANESATAATGTRPNNEADEGTELEDSETAADAPLTADEGRQRSWRLFVAAPSASFQLGPFPGWSGGTTVAIGLRSHNWIAGFAASAALPRTLSSTDRPGYSARVQTAAAELHACWASRAGAFEVSPCGVLTLNHLQAEGSGENVEGRSASINWLSMGGALTTRWYVLEWMAVGLSASGQIEAARPRIFVDGVGVLVQASQARLTLRLGPEWIF